MSGSANVSGSETANESVRESVNVSMNYVHAHAYVCMHYVCR